MSVLQVFVLLLAMSVAVNFGCVAAFITLRTGVGWARAVLTGGGAAGATLVIFFSAVAAYNG